MKNRILFIISVIGSVFYLIGYAFLSSLVLNSILVVTAVIILYLFWEIRTEFEKNRSLKVGLWITSACIALIPRLFLQPDMELSYKVIWTLLFSVALFYEVSREFKWFSK